MIMLLFAKTNFEIYTIEVIFENEFETIDICLSNTPTISLEFYIKHVISSHNSEMIIKTISDVRNMTYKYYLNNPCRWLKDA